MDLMTLVRRYIAAGWCHRWKALGLAWLICLAGWGVVYTLPNQYQANARIYADAEAILGALLRGIALDSSPAAQMDMLQRTLLSRPNVERVIARTDLDLRVTDAASRDALIAQLGRDIKLTPQTSQLFRVEYRDHDPRIAYTVVQTVIALFMESATGNDRQQMNSARTFVGQQIAAYEAQLRDAERRRAEFRARYLDLLPGDGGGSRLEQARAKQQSLRGEILDLRGRRDMLRQQAEATPATLQEAASFGGGGGGGGGESRLVAAERSLRDLLLRYTDQHPDVLAARSVIAELRSQGGGGSASGSGPAAPSAPRPATSGARPNPLHEQLRLRLLDAEADLASLERQAGEEVTQIERLETLARTAPHVQAEFQNLDRDYTVVRKNYEELLARRESLQIAGAARTDADRVRLDVIEPPTMPTTPIGPNRLLLATGVLVIGLGAGAALVFLLIQLDRGFYTVHDLRRLGLPVLGAVSSAQPVRRSRGAILFAGGLALLLVTFATVIIGGSALIARVPALIARLSA